MIRHFGMKPRVDEVKEPRQQLALRQVAGRAEQHDDLRQLRADSGRYLRHRASPAAPPVSIRWFQRDSIATGNRTGRGGVGWRTAVVRYSPSSRPSLKQALEAAIGRGRETRGDGLAPARRRRPAPKPAARPVPPDRARGRRDRRGCGFRRATADRDAEAARAARTNVAGSRCRRRRARRSPPRARRRACRRDASRRRPVRSKCRKAQTPQGWRARRRPARAKAVRTTPRVQCLRASTSAAAARSAARPRSRRRRRRPGFHRRRRRFASRPRVPAAGSRSNAAARRNGKRPIRSRRMSRRIMPARRPWVITASRKARPLKMSRYCSRARSSPRASARMVAAPAGAMPSSRLAATLHSPT